MNMEIAYAFWQLTRVFILFTVSIFHLILNFRARKQIIIVRKLRANASDFVGSCQTIAEYVFLNVFYTVLVPLCFLWK